MDVISMITLSKVTLSRCDNCSQSPKHSQKTTCCMIFYCTVKPETSK